MNLITYTCLFIISFNGFGLCSAAKQTLGQKSQAQSPATTDNKAVSQSHKELANKIVTQTLTALNGKKEAVQKGQTAVKVDEKAKKPVQFKKIVFDPELAKRIQGRAQTHKVPGYKNPLSKLLEARDSETGTNEKVDVQVKANTMGELTPEYIESTEDGSQSLARGSSMGSFGPKNSLGSIVGQSLLNAHQETSQGQANKVLPTSKSLPNEGTVNSSKQGQNSVIGNKDQTPLEKSKTTVNEQAFKKLRVLTRANEKLLLR